MKKIIIITLVIILAVAFVVNGKGEDKQTVHKEYIVQNGDTLYSIASNNNINNWQEWTYNVCELNNLKSGGEIFAGQKITILVYEN